MKRFQWICLFLFLFSQVFAQKHQIYIQDERIKKEAKKAILVVHGLEGDNKKRKTLMKSFVGQGYDVYVPMYISRKSFEESLQNFEVFFEEYNLADYEELNVICMILGGYVFNSFLNAHPGLKIHAIVLDRSPIQERAAFVVSHKIKLITRMVVGDVVADISEFRYIPIEKDSINIALAIESKANIMMRVFEKATLELGELDYDPTHMNQAYDDYMYVPYGHTEMYTEMPDLAGEILFFFRYGKYPGKTKRTPYQQDPFQRKLEFEE